MLTTIGDCYKGLAKPSRQPPDWLFGLAWTVILGLAAWAFVLSWDAAVADGATGWLIVPYLAWVSFAAILNRKIVALNGPFTGRRAT